MFKSLAVVELSGFVIFSSKFSSATRPLCFRFLPSLKANCGTPVSSLCGIADDRSKSLGRWAGLNFSSSVASEINIASSVRMVRDPATNKQKQNKLRKSMNTSTKLSEEVNIVKFVTLIGNSVQVTVEQQTGIVNVQFVVIVEGGFDAL